VPNDRLASLTVHHMRLLVAAADTLSLTEAAQAVGLSLSNVAEHLRTVEHMMGERLFQRVPGRRGVALTEAGVLMADRCRRALLALEGRALTEVHQDGEHDVRLVCDPSFGEWHLATLYSSFQLLHQEVRRKVTLDGSDSPTSDLIAGSCDLVVSLNHPSDPRVDAAPLHIVEEYVLVARSGHPLASDTAAPLCALEGEDLLLPSRPAGTRMLVERIASEHGAHLHVTWELSNPGALVKAAAAGLGIAAVPRAALHAHTEAQSLCLLNVQGFPVRQAWVASWVRDSISPGAHLFRAHLLRYTEEPTEP